MSDDEFRPGSYWAGLIDEYEGADTDFAPPDAASLNADTVSRLFWVLRRLHAKVADYDKLHLAELARLERRREALVGPVINRIVSIEASLRQYGLRAHLDFGKTGTILATPNGSIKSSRPLVPELSIADRVVAVWLRPLNPDAVFDEPKVGKGALREFLEAGEEHDQYRRAIDKGMGLGGLVVLDKGQVWLEPFEDNWRGVWVKVDVLGVEVEVVAGVSWKPSGEQGCGRTFTLVAA